MSTFQVKDRFVKAHLLTREEVEAYLWSDKPLPEDLTLGSASHHPIHKTISHFYARTVCGLKVEIGEWFVEFSNGHTSVYTQGEFDSLYEVAE